MAWTYLAALAALVGLTIGTYRLVRDPLAKFPGPRMAAWTSLWRVWDAYSGTHAMPSLVELHRQHGSIVRIGPNALCFSGPQAVRDIYGTDKHFPKSNFYAAAAATARGRVTPSLFSSTDARWHDDLKRAVNPAFSLSSLVQYEPFVQRAVAELLHQFDVRYADRRGDEGLVKLHEWLHWYAFDVIGEVTYGGAFGFLKTGSDVERMIKTTRSFLAHVMLVGQWPVLDQLWLKNPILLWLNRQGWFNLRPNPAVTWAQKTQAAMLEKPRGEATTTTRAAGGPAPLIIKFMQAQEKHPDIVDDKGILGLGLSMVFAGSESTAVSLAAIFYFVLKSPATYRKLRAEIDAAFPRPTDGQISFRDSFKLPYLDACIKESFRLHPAGRFTAERVLPPQGAMVDGRLIPGGTVVGVNAWPLHRREDVFGEDPDVFRPERWIAVGADDQARVEHMNRTLFQFGAGRFVCIGKNISLLEVYKVVPSLLQKFEFELDDPNAVWSFQEGSFVNLTMPPVRLRRRVPNL